MDALSQADVDRLFGGSAADATPAPQAPAPSDEPPRSGDAAGSGAPGTVAGAVRRTAPAAVHEYDFRRPQRISRERMRTLEAMYERLGKGLETWLGARVRSQVTVQLQSVDQFTFGEFTRSLPSPSVSFVYTDAGPGSPQGVIDVGSSLAFFFIERVLGGAGATPTAPERELSGVERLVLRGLAQRTCKDLADAWQDQVRLECEVTGFESSPEMLYVAAPDDPMLVAHFYCMAAETDGLLSVCVPFTMVEDFFQFSGSRRQSGASVGARHTAGTREQTEHAVRATPVAVSVHLPDFPVTLRALRALQPGEVLATNIRRDVPLVVRVSGRALYRGSPGRIGDQLAVRLDDFLAGAGESAAAATPPRTPRRAVPAA